MSDTKVRININEGTIELEGTESFVERHWEEIKLLMQQTPSPKSHGATKKSGNNSGKPPKIGKERKPLSYTPIPVNLKGDDNTPSLEKFFKEKLPNGNQEIITVFAYYLKHHCNIPNMEMGHAVSCYNEVGERIPKNIYSVCINTHTRKGYLDYGDVAYSFKVTITGENLIKHDLPRPAKSKTK